MPQFLYRIQPTRLAMLTEGLTAIEERVIDAHFAYLRALAARGTVVMAGRTLNDDETTFGIVIFVAESEAAALETMRNDPAVKGGVMRAELFPYRIALWSALGPGGDVDDP